jgi:phage terminase large subunit-like protein
VAIRIKPTAAEPVKHAEQAAWYIENVLSGAIPAGQRVHQACRRQLKDLKNTGWRYRFDSEKGARVCRFIENLPHTKGKWAAQREKIKLQPWQCFLVVVLFGWIDKKTGMRRFRVAYWEIPRKNGKSILAAGIGLYMAFADGEFGAEVYSGATTEKQAHEVWKPAKLMMMREHGFAAALAVDVRAKSLVREIDESKFEPVIGNPGDGSSPSCAIIDEFHEHDTPDQYDTMETGMGAREQPLILVITTAGANIAGPCHAKHDEVCKVLEGSAEDDETFGCIFGCDPADDWASPATLRKANPNFGVSVDGEFLERQQRNAMQNPIQQNKFKTKHLNIWCNVLAGIMNMTAWAACADPELDEEDCVGLDAWIGIDLASKLDLCAEQRLYRKEGPVADKPHFYLFGTYWLPEAAVEEPGPNHAHYEKWVKQGHLIQTDGAVVDFELITDMVKADCKRVNPQEVVYDPFNASQFAQGLAVDGIVCVEFTQNPQNFAVPIDELQAAVKDGRFHHDGNPITTWCFSNTVGRPAKKGLLSPVKQKGKDHQKIDGFVATAIAMARAAPGEQSNGIDEMLRNPIITR